MSTDTKEQQAIKALVKLERQQRQVILGITNKLKSQYSFGNIKTWKDCYHVTGYDDAYIAANFTVEQCAKPIDRVELGVWCDKLTNDLENKLKERKHETENKSIVPAPVANTDTSSVSSIAQPVLPEPTNRKETTVSNAHFQTSQAVSSLDESGFNNSNDYGLSPSALEKGFLFWFQKRAAKEALDKVVDEKKPAILIIASTGTGKTFICAAIDRRLKDIKFENEKTWGHVNYLSITRSSVVEQTKRVNTKFFGIKHPNDTEVINIEQLRARAGQIWIMCKNVIVDGEEREVYEWKKLINPCVIYWDECQALKNDSSIQHKIAIKYSAIDTPTTQIFLSATPFTRVSEAKAFAIATRKDISYLGFPHGTRLSESTWPTYAAAISSPSLPDEYNEAAVERLMKDLDDYIVRVKGVRWQFNAINSVEIIDFDSPASRAEYDEAWDKYLIRKAKLEESITDNPRFQALVELGIFLAAAEYCKRHIFAARMYHDVQEGYAAVLACKFKKTIIAVTKILHEKYGVDRDNISLIWGGGQTQLTAKQKLKAKVTANLKTFQEAGVTMEDMMLDDVDDRVLEDLPPELRLGIQSKERRQYEIDRFQSGKSLYCIYTYKAGGVGLSLHHTDEQTNYKVRRQKNGYAVVEDIPNVPTRPRKATVGPTWSPIELVQGCGRVPRLTSLSDTIQNFLYYRGTVEEQQAFVVTHRLKCLSKVVRQHEAWADLITNYHKAKELARALVENGPPPDTDEEQHDIGGDTGEDE
jgi:DNA replication protein DnaC